MATAVGDDHVCRRQALHHTPLGSLAHLGALPPLDLGIPLCILILILHFLFGHLHVFLELVLLVEPICNPNKQVNQADPQAGVNYNCAPAGSPAAAESRIPETAPSDGL